MAVTDYYLLDYISSTSGTGQYINLNIYPNTAMKSVLRAKYNTTDESGYMLGICSNTRYHIGAYQSGWHFGLGTVYDSVGSFDTNWHTWQLDSTDGKCYVDAQLLDTLNYTGVPTNSYITLFIENQGSGAIAVGGKANCSIQYCQIYSNGSLVRNMVAAKRKSDNVLGMYDLVENKFYTNAGSGSFTAGSMSSSSVNVNINNTLWGTTSSTSGYKYVDSSVTVILTATPKTGCTFSGWYDTNNNLVSNSMRYEYTGPVNSGLTAVFSVPHIYLKLNGHWKDIV